MHATDIQPIIEAVKNIEKNDLIRALRAHGGTYDFTEDPDPVSVEFQGGDGPCSGTVLRARLTERPGTGASRRTGVAILVDDTDCDQYEVTDGDVYAGFLSGITDAMEEPEDHEEA